jgi:hypothetical protein
MPEAFARTHGFEAHPGLMPRYTMGRTSAVDRLKAMPLPAVSMHQVRAFVRCMLSSM